MRKQNPPSKPNKQVTIGVDVGPELLAVCHDLRRQIQDAIPTSRRISLGDVVRLALRRLQMAVILHQGEAEEDPVENCKRYMQVFDVVRHSGTCPDFLIPGQPEKPGVSDTSPAESNGKGKGKGSPKRQQKGA
jgi:hypothetical protein